MKGFRESTDSITLSLIISEYECPFLLKISICPYPAGLDKYSCKIGGML
jgi:hypothetical protein